MALLLCKMYNDRWGSIVGRCCDLAEFDKVINIDTKYWSPMCLYCYNHDNYETLYDNKSIPAVIKWKYVNNNVILLTLATFEHDAFNRGWQV